MSSIVVIACAGIMSLYMIYRSCETTSKNKSERETSTQIRKIATAGIIIVSVLGYLAEVICNG